MKYLDLFSGIGGVSLAAQSLGIETAQFVEINPYCCHVLRKNFPTIPIHRDIRTFHAKPNQFDLITGGSPCQDLSLAGKRAGITGDRSGLWFEMLRVIEEAKPRFVIWENVKGAFYTGGLTKVLHGLCQLGYRFDVEILSAAAVGVYARNHYWIGGTNRDLLGLIGMRGFEADPTSTVKMKKKQPLLDRCKSRAKKLFSISGFLEFFWGVKCKNQTGSGGGFGFLSGSGRSFDCCINRQRYRFYVTEPTPTLREMG
ncbi:DNA cytosine methyltransferase [Pseudanabaena sp. PCC 6802]|uniref:DNA cytosine methyltransferase n=1 Tax=Pseudanabaena sp. PCC 6802 TaxID=118173 RepID=UPI0003496366|nr:DNA cytosine methyltransferase [Pseudanabaena sp. PCC 6802]